MPVFWHPRCLLPRLEILSRHTLQCADWCTTMYPFGVGQFPLKILAWSLLKTLVLVTQREVPSKLKTLSQPSRRRGSLQYPHPQIPKNPRAAPSTLLNEATSMSKALADSVGVASWSGSYKELHYDLRNRDLLNRDIKIATSTTCHEDSELDLATIADAKRLHGNLVQEQ